MRLTDHMPVYVTRVDETGETGTLSLAVWMPLVALLLVWLNVIMWGVIGVIEAVKHAV